ncbi:uncharacterized protein DS421_11g332720 [Arachis hypogaea]|nr:uncharacterized protein DS421_11g332720 [Arachis hypogaea]
MKILRRSHKQTTRHTLCNIIKNFKNSIKCFALSQSTFLRIPPCIRAYSVSLSPNLLNAF